LVSITLSFERGRKNCEFWANQIAKFTIYTGVLFTRDNLGKMVSHRVHLSRGLKNALWAELDTNLTALASFWNKKNLAVWGTYFCEIEGSAREDFHSDLLSLSTTSPSALGALATCGTANKFERFSCFVSISRYTKASRVASDKYHQKDSVSSSVLPTHRGDLRDQIN
jgi:hypothetical protein